MAKESHCPGKKLETIIDFLDEDSFELLMKEFSLGEIEQIVRTNKPYATDEEIEEAYKEDLKAKVKERKNAEELFNYGSTREEILENLRKHVNYCEFCFNKYMTFIIRETNKDFRAAEKIVSEEVQQPAILEYCREMINAGFSEVLKWVDENSLQIFR